MAIYKYVPFSNLKFILDGTIRFTQPKAFNDPFELLPELHLDRTVENINFDIMSAARSSFPAKLPDDFKSENCSDIASRDLLSAINDHIGILCLSRNNNNLLMWSHYADEYKGAVVEFDDDHEFFKGLISIQYEENRPKLEFDKLLNDQEHINISELCYKPKAWEYENEHRVIRNLKDCNKSGNFNGFDVYAMEIPRECIKSITFGERMPIHEQRYIVGKTHDTDICLSLAAISNWGYGFRYEQIKFNKPLTEMNPVISPRTANIFKDLNGTLGDLAKWMLNEHPMAEMANKTL